MSPLANNYHARFASECFEAQMRTQMGLINQFDLTLATRWATIEELNLDVVRDRKLKI